MKHPYVTRDVLIDFIRQLDRDFGRPGRLYLIGETSQVFENWRRWTPQVEFNAEVASIDQDAFTEQAIQQDPAKFRRKYKGLGQMWRAVEARKTQRPAVEL